jgi:putative chitinase
MSDILLGYQKLHSLAQTGKMDIGTIKHIQKSLLVTDVAMANLLGQLHIESNGFKARRESMNYDVKGLIDTFAFFRRNPILAESYGRTATRRANQEMIANIVYDDKNRSPKFKLGNIRPGDGWRLRGGFGIQITGRTNYTRLSETLKDPLILTDPDKVIEKYYFASAKWYMDDRNLWGIASKGISMEVSTLLTQGINGGKAHLAERHEWALHYKKILDNAK